MTAAKTKTKAKTKIKKSINKPKPRSKGKGKEMAIEREWPSKKVNREEVDKAFYCLIGMPAREADQKMVEIMGGNGMALWVYMSYHWRVRTSIAKKVIREIIIEKENRK